LATIVIQLDPARMANPDLDIRYRLPDLLIARSDGRLTDDGYDYVGDRSQPCLQLYLHAEDAFAALPTLVELLKSERVLNNDLSDVPVAIEDGDAFRIVHPPGFAGAFPRPDSGR
jgi:hypothetical protein